MSEIDRRIDRLDDALRRAGLGPLAPARDTAALDAIAEAIAPWALPGDLRRFWQRVEADSFPVSGWRMGTLAAPAVALSTHRLNLEPGFALLYGPPLLFPIARHSETQWSIELASEWGAGGAVFSHDDGHRLEYASFGELIEVYAELIEEREFVLLDAGRASLTLAGERSKQQRRLGARPQRAYPADPSGWPAHWLASAGIDPRAREPLGATHTIEELARAAADGTVRGRVAGLVTGLAGTGEGMLVRVDDGTATLDIWCPAGVSPWGPRHRERFEFEVVVAPGASAVATAIRRDR